ncbi:hypothetical protein WJX72_005215 [[Myrmecia] bisecta]|uniref:Protein kinase domain-containing protein n=1 Tax=[Myrmecia] bisecta TaxID=41462 RepID=A0AAW1PCW8_9CHLO
MGAPDIAEEQDRLSHLRSLATPKHGQTPSHFHDLAHLVCDIFSVPVGGVTMLESDLCLLPSYVGVDGPSVPRNSSFCPWTLLPAYPELMLIPDTLEDARFRDNPLVVKPPHMRFWAGVPLVAATGHRLGSLCISDTRPRDLDAESCNLLCNLAELAVRELERDTWLKSQAEKQQSPAFNVPLLRPLNTISEAVLFMDVSLPRWPILFANSAFAELTGMLRTSMINKNIWDAFEYKGKRGWDSMEAYAREGKEFVVKVLNTAGSTSQSLTLTFRPSSTDALDGRYPHVGIPGTVAMQGTPGCRYYFATVVLTAPTSQPALPSLPTTHNSGGSTSSSSQSPTNRGVSGPFGDDVVLGPMLGQGGYGRVYRGRWQGSVVAVKIIESMLKEGSAGPKQVEATVETQLAGGLVHPNIVRTFKYGTQQAKTSHLWSHYGGEVELDDDSPSFLETWVVMEHCDKGTLQAAIDQGWLRKKRSIVDGPPDMRAIHTTAQEIAAAMVFLHNKDILHGDLAGGNVLLCSSNVDGRCFIAKVADFGLARVLTSNNAKTQSCGTITHSAPERIMQGMLSKGSDVYSYGVLLWEMYMGQRPWGGVQAMSIIHQVAILKKTLTFAPGAPRKYEELAMDCLAFDYQARPSFEQVAKRLMAMSDLMLPGNQEDQDAAPVPPIRYRPSEWGIDASASRLMVRDKSLLAQDAEVRSLLAPLVQGSVRRQ